MRRGLLLTEIGACRYWPSRTLPPQALDGMAFGGRPLPLLGAGETEPAPAVDIARSFLGLCSAPFRGPMALTRSVCTAATSSCQALSTMRAIRALRRGPGASGGSDASPGVGLALRPLGRLCRSG